MTPIVTLWLSDTTSDLESMIDARMDASGFSATLYRSVSCRDTSLTELTARLNGVYRELIQLDATDTTLHLVAVVPLAEASATAKATDAIRALTDLTNPVSLEVIGLQMTLTEAVGLGKCDEARKNQSENISGISAALADAPFQHTFSVIDDYVASGAAIGFDLELLARFLSAFFSALIENFRDLYVPAIYENASGMTIGVGLSRVEFNRNEIIDYLLHRSFVAALDKVGITIENVDAQGAADRAFKTLTGVDNFFNEFYDREVEPLVAKRLPEGEIAAKVHPKLQEDVDSLGKRLTTFMSDDSLSLPEKEATLAMVLGRDNPRLRGMLYKQQTLLLDDAFTQPVELYLEAYNSNAPGTPLLPFRGEYEELKYPEPVDSETGIAAEDIRNSYAFNPLADIKQLKSDILDLTAFVRRKESELDTLRKNADNEVMKDGELTEEGFRIRNLVKSEAEVVEQPLSETYTPSPGLKTAPSVDLRTFFSGIRNQKELGSCSSFSVVSMYESIMNRLNPDKPKADMSERYLFYHTNVLTGRPEGGSNFHEQLEALGKYGICTEALYPYEVDKILNKPSATATEDASSHRVLEARQIPLVSDGNKYDAIVENHRLLTSALSEGYPVGFSLHLYEDFGAGTDGYISRPSDISEDKDVGYHAMVLVGYSERDKCYIVRNSWGTDFGDNGYCYISSAYIDDPEFNRFAFIITKTTEGVPDLSREGKVPQLVAQFGGTEIQIKMAAINNALDEAKIHLSSLIHTYESNYRYYSDLLARLAQPNVRNELRRLAEEASASRLLVLENHRLSLVNQFTTTLNEFCRRYLINCLRVSGIALLGLGASGIITNYFGIDYAKWYWVAAAIVTFIAVLMWLHYTTARRKKKLELNEEIGEIADRVHAEKRRLLEMQLKFHIGGMVIDSIYQLASELDTTYQRLVGYNSNLLCWHTEDSAKAAGISSESRGMFVTLTDTDLLGKYFEEHSEEITSRIDLMEQFKTFALTESVIQDVRNNLELLTRDAIKALLSDFNMGDYLRSRAVYDYVLPPQLDPLMKRLNRMAAVTTRHNDNDNTRETRYAALNIHHDQLASWRQLSNPLFSFPPQTVITSDTDTFTLITLRLIEPGLLQL
ncbi:MAG: C1 family peptidase [Duncaniella sp.]|nr:C1 family peptidase [Duncaniella sp.]